MAATAEDPTDVPEPDALPCGRDTVADAWAGCVDPDVCGLFADVCGLSGLLAFVGLAVGVGRGDGLGTSCRTCAADAQPAGRSATAAAPALGPGPTINTAPARRPSVSWLSRRRKPVTSALGDGDVADSTSAER